MRPIKHQLLVQVEWLTGVCPVLSRRWTVCTREARPQRWIFPSPLKCCAFVVVTLAGLATMTVRAQEAANTDQQGPLWTLEESPQRAQMEEKIQKAREVIQKFGGGHIVLGRIVLDGPGNVQDVLGQMDILPEGYFVWETKDLEQPIGFRLHQYAPLDVELKGYSGEIVDLGTLHMTPLPAEELVNLTGKLVLKGEKDMSKAKMELSIRGWPVNTPSGGIFRQRWPASIRADIARDGRISTPGLSPFQYMCSIKAPGYVNKSMTLTINEDKTFDLGEIVLEKPKQIELTYIVAEKPPFDAKNKKKTLISGGEKWKATEDIYGWDLEFPQEGGEIQFKSFYLPCYLKDLGAGKITDYLDYEIFPTDSPNNIKVQNGHVYLLNQQHLKHWVIFSVRVK